MAQKKGILLSWLKASCCPTWGWKSQCARLIGGGAGWLGGLIQMHPVVLQPTYVLVIVFVESQTQPVGGWCSVLSWTICVVKASGCMVYQQGLHGLSASSLRMQY